MSPELLDELPLDQMNGEPLQLRMENGKPFFYSTGNDGGGLQANEDVYNYNDTKLTPHHSFSAFRQVEKLTPTHPLATTQLEI